MENELCYYCDLSTFKSIIQNQTFWLSDLHYMNDSAEESLFLDALSAVMRKQRDGLSKETKEYLDKNEYMDEFFTNIKKTYKGFSYICCFSDEENDDLSQWRGYASDGTGLCIGFKKDKIQLLKEARLKQNKINYLDKDKIMEELEEKISPIIKDFDDNIMNLDAEEIDVSFISKLVNETYYNRAFYKNESFKSEKEYRICFFDYLHEGAIGVADKALMKNMQERYRFKNGTTLSELKYREGRGAFIPYREMKFTKEYFKEMLSSVTIGPKNPMSVNDVKFFLLANGFDTKNIKVLKSKSTYQ